MNAVYPTTNSSCGLLLIILLVYFIPLGAQNEEFSVYRKIADDQLYLRWLPRTLADFQHVLAGNMRLEVYRVGGSTTEPELTLLEEQAARPLAYAAWREQLTTSTWDTLALTSMYGPVLDAAFLDRTFLAPVYKDTGESAWLHRYEFSNYGLGYFWPAIERSGFGYTRPLDDGVGLYAFKLYPTARGDTLWIDFDVRSYTVPAVPELVARFKDLRVELQWRTLEYRRDFFGWQLERSLDGGQQWEPLFDLPLINDNDTLAGAGEALKFLYHEDVLPANDLPVVYRLRGADFLGGLSANESRVAGAGREDIRRSPLLLETLQTDSNHAVIRWEFAAEKETLLQEFRILETDTSGTHYRVALAGIDPQAREVSVPMKFRANFFRVQAVSQLGTELSSFESLVMAYDVDPPAIPRDFTGYIDSAGLAHLRWITSDEPDLAGYYLFKGYFEGRELAMITADPLAGPTYQDTVNQATGNEWVYYQLSSVDIRGNSSAFTPVLALKKPDVFPPAPPQFTKVDNDDQRVFLRWTTSPSPDVRRYDLYRRALETEPDFRLLHTFGAAAFQANYTDSLVRQGLTYVYTLLVTDDDGLESEPAQPVSLRLKDYGIRSPIENFTGRPGATARTIELNWRYAATPREYNLYRRQDDAPLSLIKVLPGNQFTYLDQGLQRGSTYHYVLRAVFSDGDTSPYTEEVQVVVE